MTVSIPTLTTERLTLRAPEDRDFPAYAAFRASDRARFVGGPNSEWDAWNMLCSIAGHWQIRGYGRWIVADKSDDRALGVVGPFYPIDWPEPEIAWTMFGGAEGKGYAYEAATAARRFAYDTLGWRTASSFVSPENTRSVALAKRLGCVPDGVHEHRTFGPLHIWRHPAPAEVLA